MLQKFEYFVKKILYYVCGILVYNCGAGSVSGIYSLFFSHNDAVEPISLIVVEEF